MTKKACNHVLAKIVSLIKNHLFNHVFIMTLSHAHYIAENGCFMSQNVVKCNLT